MTKKPSRHIVDILAVLILLILFTACALSVVLLGAGVYQKTVANMTGNFTVRTSLAYITEMVHQSDSEGNISVSEKDGLSVLALQKTYGGEAYTTYIYAEGNELKELTQKTDAEFKASAGRTIMEIGSFSAEKDGRLLHLTVTDENGSTEETSVAVRSES